MTDKSERFIFSLSEADRDALDALAAEQGTSVAAVLRDLLQREVDRQAANSLTEAEIVQAAKMGLSPSQYKAGKERR
jgi:hypothetical protein